ncbi:phosphoribulokinase/uridine kinase family protein [Aspergillus foveolatus]|uniref:phosphoribulokinase/uridine kinase family protein n=1 Tax=Aspergillus foveolatus TaxID=210207 RepID=UPI003CCCCD0C
MEEQYAALASKITSLAISQPKPRYLVAVAGAPGSGKTTLATAVAAQINRSGQLSHKSANQSDDTSQTNGIAKRALVLSMDGFHLPRSELDALPEKERTEAYVRRGAPWTFDVQAFLQFMRTLRSWADSDSPSSSSEEMAGVLYAPTFSHSTKDPIPNSLVIDHTTSIVIIEGNYLLLNEPQWRDIAPLVDYRVFVDVDLAEARERLAKRHVEAGIAQTLEEGLLRVDRNDAINGALVKGRVVDGVDMVVRSLRDGTV